MVPDINFDHITIVLHQPRFAENIGASARAAWNMGFPHIILVNPEDTDWERMTKLSTHVARGLLEKMQSYSSLAEALAPFHYIVGTTARLGGQRKEIINPAQAARKIQSLGGQNRIALLFGPENRGLSNEELRFCHCTVNIPTASASSLNLAQGVLILCYEILLAHSDEKVRSVEFGVRSDQTLNLEISSSITPNSELRTPNSEHPLATSFELEGMYQHLSEVLQLMDFLDEQNPELWMMSLRRFFSRIGLYPQEVRMIRGICRQLRWLVTGHLKSNTRIER
ncbi:MAG: RNA methyltransferase [Deltaproteobacteria bacterium]|nr:RNA methyltransferase [Deltaproteobacteria bacterium]